MDLSLMKVLERTVVYINKNIWEIKNIYSVSTDDIFT